MGGRRASSASRLKLEKSELGGARDEWPVRELRLRTAPGWCLPAVGGASHVRAASSLRRVRFGGLVTSLARPFMVQIGSMQQRGHKLRPLRNLNHDNRPQAGLTPVSEFPLVLWAFLQLDIRGNFQNTAPTLLPRSSAACAVESPRLLLFTPPSPALSGWFTATPSSNRPPNRPPRPRIAFRSPRGPAQIESRRHDLRAW